MKKEVAQVPFREGTCIFRTDQASLYGGEPYPVVINAAAIIFDFDVNVVTAMVGTYGDVAVVALPGLVALVIALDAMGHRIAHQVNEGIGNLLNDVVVEFRFGAGQGELHAFAGGLRGVAH